MFTKFKHSLAINFLCSFGTFNFQIFVINPQLKQLSIENKQLSIENKQLSIEFTDLRRVFILHNS
jgi:hypothetical protein